MATRGVSLTPGNVALPEDLIITVVAAGACGALAVYWVMSYDRRAWRAIAAWAETSNLTIASARLCLLWGGPFWLELSWGQVVYRIVVIDGKERLRSGWVRCRPFSSRVVVRWDQAA